MERDPRDFERKPPEDGGNDAAFDRWVESLPPAPGIPSTPEEVAAADARAEEDIAAGRGYPHELVGQWLKTWGSTDRKPFKEWLADQNG